MGVADRLVGLAAIARSGILRPIRPDRFVNMVREAGKYGQTAAAACGVSAARYPDGGAVIDEHGTLSWRALDQLTNAIAAELALGPGDVVGILCRNHRGFVEAMVTAAKLGLDVVLLNTGFAGPQLGEVARREGVTVLVHDRSFATIVEESGLAGEIRTIPGWPVDLPGAEHAGVHPPPPPPERQGGVVILSSGTTGTPKGAKRTLGAEGGGAARSGVAQSLGMLTRLPIRALDTTLIAAPLFHSWGLSNFLLCATFSSPMVLQERFAPEDVLAAIARHGVGTLVAVPAMLERILALPSDVRKRHDTSSLRLVALSGSALPGGLSTRWMDAFGDNLHSLYGSTEVAAVAIAGPADLRAAPDTAGPIVAGVDVRLLDENGAEVRPSIGTTGRIFVRSDLLFEGYTGGGNKAMIDGFMSSGDVGHFDAAGRLFVDGREDDMIVSGGENVFPQEVEEVILSMAGVADAAVVGVDDPQFGQRLRAIIVPAAADVPTVDAVRDHVRSQLANFKVPRDVVFRDELPRNTTGKVLRRVLIEEAGA